MFDKKKKTACTELLYAGLIKKLIELIYCSLVTIIYFFEEFNLNECSCEIIIKQSNKR